MTHKEIVQKLIGPIHPIGESNADNARFENLKTLCDLVNDLVTDIDSVGYENKDHYEYSRKRAADYVSVFMTKTLGISD